MKAPARTGTNVSSSGKSANSSIAADRLDEALQYANLGYGVFPCKRNAKYPITPNGKDDANTDPDQIRTWFQRDVNVGLLPPSNVLALDVDSLERLEVLLDTFPALTNAPLHHTPRPGAHVFVRLPDGWRMPSRVETQPDVTVRGMANTYLIAPPSYVIEPQYRGHYKVIRPLVSPPELPEAPPDLLEYLTQERERPQAPPAQWRPPQGGTTPYGQAALDGELYALRSTTEGTRNDQLNDSAFALGQLTGSGEIEDAQSVKHELLDAALTCGLPQSEACNTIESGFSAGLLKPRTAPEDTRRAPTRRAAPSANTSTSTFVGEPDTDRANAIRLQASEDGTLGFTPGDGWRLYAPATGTWPILDDERMLAIAQERLPKLVYDEATGIIEQARDATGETRKALNTQAAALLKWAKRCEMKRPVSDALEMLKGRVLIKAGQWDADPYLLNLPNGVYDLRADTLLPHSPKHRMTQLAGATYNEDATHWALDSLVTLLQRDGRAGFVQRALGSTLCGYNPNELLVAFVGVGGTGKSTLVEAAMTALGTYSVVVDTGTFVETRYQRPDGPRADLLALRGARFAVGRELPKNAQMNATDIKALTGNDTIVARPPYGKKPIEFKPTFKLFVHSNYDLKADWDDTGVQRRLVRVPFDAKPDQPDPRVKEALTSEPQAKSAMLSWLLKGYREWVAAGYKLEPPETVKESTRAYWHDQDPFALWAEDCVTLDGSTPFVSNSDLRRNYSMWCEREGVKPQSSVALGKWLSTRSQDLESVKQSRGSGGERGWTGVRLKGPTG